VLISKVKKAFNLTETEAKHYVETLGGIPPAKDTKVKVHDDGTSKTTSDKIDTAAKDRDSRITVTPDMSEFDPSVSKYLNGKKYYVTVVARPGKNVAT
jgi:hypothetical protein